jgi:hypothetical protein
MDVRIERPTGGWWRCGADLPQLPLRDSLDWPVRSAREGFHFPPLANVLCPFSAEAESTFSHVLINGVTGMWPGPARGKKPVSGVRDWSRGTTVLLDTSWQMGAF